MVLYVHCTRVYTEPQLYVDKEHWLLRDCRLIEEYRVFNAGLFLKVNVFMFGETAVCNLN